MCVYIYACVYAKSLQSCLTVTLWTLANQASLSMGFSRQEYSGGLLCPPPGDLTDQGMELVSLMSPALAGRFFTTSATWKAYVHIYTLFLYSFLLWFITGY